MLVYLKTLSQQRRLYDLKVICCKWHEFGRKYPLTIWRNCPSHLLGRNGRNQKKNPTARINRYLPTRNQKWWTLWAYRGVEWHTYRTMQQSPTYNNNPAEFIHSPIQNSHCCMCVSWVIGYPDNHATKLRCSSLIYTQPVA